MLRVKTLLLLLLLLMLQWWPEHGLRASGRRQRLAWRWWTHHRCSLMWEEHRHGVELEFARLGFHNGGAASGSRDATTPRSEVDGRCRKAGVRGRNGRGEGGVEGKGQVEQRMWMDVSGMIMMMRRRREWMATETVLGGLLRDN